MLQHLVKIVIALLLGCASIGQDRVEFNPNLLMVDELLNIANSEYLAENFDSAAMLAHRILDLDPCNHIAMDILGLIEYELGNMERSTHYFASSVKCNPSYTRGYLHLAVSLQLLGRQEEAVQFFNKAAALNPLDEELEDVRDIINSGQADTIFNAYTVFYEVKK